jgi:hypothetical protein
VQYLFVVKNYYWHCAFLFFLLRTTLLLYIFSLVSMEKIRLKARLITYCSISFLLLQDPNITPPRLKSHRIESIVCVMASVANELKDYQVNHA